MTEWLGLPPLAASHGGQIDGLIGWIHVFMLVLFVGWGGFFTYCLFRFRRSRNPVADYAGVRSHRSSYLEVGVAVVEAVLLFGFAIPLWAARVDAIPPESDALVVHVTAEQFAWNVRYAGPDGVFGRTDIMMIDTQSSSCSLFMTNGGAKRMMLPCVGFANSPFSFSAMQISHAVELSSVSLITIAFSNPFPRTNTAMSEPAIYSPIFSRKI